jgi:hypothetical protein
MWKIVQFSTVLEWVDDTPELQFRSIFRLFFGRPQLTSMVVPVIACARPIAMPAMTEMKIGERRAEGDA